MTDKRNTQVRKKHGPGSVFLLFAITALFSFSCSKGKKKDPNVAKMEKLLKGFEEKAGKCKQLQDKALGEIKAAEEFAAQKNIRKGIEAMPRVSKAVQAALSCSEKLAKEIDAKKGKAKVSEEVAKKTLATWTKKHLPDAEKLKPGLDAVAKRLADLTSANVLGALKSLVKDPNHTKNMADLTAALKKMQKLFKKIPGGTKLQKKMEKLIKDELSLEKLIKEKKTKQAIKLVLGQYLVLRDQTWTSKWAPQHLPMKAHRAGTKVHGFLETICRRWATMQAGVLLAVALAGPRDLNRMIFEGLSKSYGPLASMYTKRAGAMAAKMIFPLMGLQERVQKTIHKNEYDPSQKKKMEAFFKKMNIPVGDAEKMPLKIDPPFKKGMAPKINKNLKTPKGKKGGGGAWAEPR